jgi:hypothetical protein
LVNLTEIEIPKKMEIFFQGWPDLLGIIASTEIIHELLKYSENAVSVKVFAKNK